MEHRRASKTERRRKGDPSVGHRHRPGGHPNQVPARVLKETNRAQQAPRKENPELPPFREEDDYVHQWLLQTNKESDPNFKKSRAERVKSDTFAGHRDKNQKATNILHPSSHGFDLLGRQMQPRRKRMHNSSSDSSLLEPATALRPTKAINPDHKIGKNKVMLKSSHPPLKQFKMPPSEEGSSTTLSIHRHGFEKRARHKTRENLYDSKNEKKPLEKKDGLQKARAKRAKKGDEKRAARKAGEDLMNNFKSKSISKYRLTIPPSNGPGLFKNGRASSPARRRGLPDLAFSEMDFLQRSAHAMTAHKDEKTVSKSRSNEKRRTERAHYEISTFFGNGRASLIDTSPNTRYKRSAIHMSDSLQSHIRSRSSDFVEGSCLGFGQPSPFARRLSTSRKRPTPGNRLGDEPDLATTYSGKATTYVTWSETSMSPQGTTALEKHSNDRDQISPTPDSVRISLENTGIFRDTGISMASKKNRSLKKVLLPYNRTGHDSNVARGALKEPSASILNTKLAGNSILKVIEDSAKPLCTRHQSYSPESSLNNQRIAKRSPVPDERPISIDIEDKSSEICPRRVVIERYDKHLGWHQNQVSKTPEELIPRLAQSFTAVREVKRTPIDREQLAWRARIKRPLSKPRFGTSAMREIPLEDRGSQDMPDHTIKTLDTLPCVTLEKNTKTFTEFQGSESQSTNSHAAIQTSQNQKISVGNARNDIKDDALLESGTVPGPPSIRQDGKLTEANPFANLSLPKVESIIRDRKGVGQEKIMNPDFNATNGILPGLPVRGLSWIGRRGAIDAPARLTPVIELEPLYFRQIYRNYGPDTSTDKYEEGSYQHVEKDHVAPDDWLNPYLEGLERVEEDGGESCLLKEQDLHSHYGKDAAYTEKEALPPESWQDIGHSGVREVENYETYQYTERNMLHPHGDQSNYCRTIVYLPDGAEQDYEGYDVQADVFPPKFWRPNRCY